MCGEVRLESVTVIMTASSISTGSWERQIRIGRGVVRFRRGGVRV